MKEKVKPYLAPVTLGLNLLIVMLGLDPSIQVNKFALLFNLDPRVKPEGDRKERSSQRVTVRGSYAGQAEEWQRQGEWSIQPIKQKIFKRQLKIILAYSKKVI